MVRLARQLHAAVNRGNSLGTTLASMPDFIPPFIAEMIAEAERKGELVAALNSCAEYLHSVSLLMPNQPSKIKRVLFYPIVVLAIVFVITMVLMVFVVPQFTIMFDGFAADLPALTAFVIAVSQTLEVWFPLLLLIAFALFALWRWGIPRSAAVQRMAIQLLSLVPGYRKLYRKIYSAILLLTWGFLLSRGMKLSEAVAASSQLSLGPYWREQLLAIKHEVDSDEFSTANMASRDLLTPRLAQLLMLANRLDNFDSLLSGQGSRYCQQVEESYKDVVQLFEPFLITLIGIIVGVIVVAMYLPIFMMGDVV
jgi:type II secretory pathway component PulF